MNLLCAGANAAWLLTSMTAAAAFRAGCGRVPAVQRRILLDIVKRNRFTDFGRRHGFDTIRSIGEYQDRVPIRTYDDFAPDWERIQRGEPNVLTASSVDHFEPTSGSSGPAKLIPYTAELRQDFHRAIAPWVVESARANPAGFAGKAYWSISPVVSPSTRTPGGTRIGFERDDEYLGPVKGALVRAVQAVPPNVRLQSDVEDFRRMTLFHLLLSESLSLISVWHPGFMMLLLSQLREDADSLIDDLAVVSRRRAARVRDAVATANSAADLHRMLWPELRSISCWADAGSAIAARDLAARFPHSRIEPKGLLSTEGIVSVPFGGAHALAYRSHFFELQQAGTETVITASEARVGERYRVILTTSGGLYRYATGDLVDVTGFHETIPLLRFAGRADHVVDHFGEKLHEVFVRERLDRALNESEVRATFAMLACEKSCETGHYTLFIESHSPARAVAEAAQRLDELLRDNFHYDYCRRLGQLSAIRVLRLSSGASHVLLRGAATRQRLGNVKAASLDGGTDWAERFAAAET